MFILPCDFVQSFFDKMYLDKQQIWHEYVPIPPLLFSMTFKYFLEDGLLAFHDFPFHLYISTRYND